MALDLGYSAYKKIHWNTLKFQEKPVAYEPAKKSALQHSLFWRYANFQIGAHHAYLHS